MVRRGTWVGARGGAAFVGALLAGGLAARAWAEEPEGQEGGGGQVAAVATPQVVLERSFQVDLEQAGSLSHVPAVVFTPDGRFMFTGTAQGEVLQFATDTREVVRRLRFSQQPIQGVAIDDRGEVLVWLSADQVLEARSLAAEGEAGEVLGRVEGLAAQAIALAPDGRALAVLVGGRLELRRLPDLEVLVARDVVADALTNVAWAPDATALAVTSQGGALHVLGAADLATRCEVQEGSALFAVAFAPDGARVAFGGLARQVSVLHLESGAHAVAISGQPYYITTLGFSPRGDKLAIGDESCDVWIYEVPTNARLFHGKHHVECWLSCVAWAPDDETFLFGCRPNSLADRPQVWNGNNVAEAFQDPEHQELLRAEAACLDALLTKARAGELGEAGQRLVTLLEERQAAAGERATTLQVLGANAAELAAGLDVETEGALQLGAIEAQGWDGLQLVPAGARAGAAEDEQLQAALRELDAGDEAVQAFRDTQQQRASCYQKRFEDISRNFQINVWSVRGR